MIEQLISSASKIKLTGGLVGRLCLAVLIICATIGGVAVTSPVWWVAPCAIVLIFVFALLIFWRVLNFAHKNPYVAILDGAELLKYEELTYRSKNEQEFGTDIELQADAYSIPLLKQQELANTAETPDEEIVSVLSPNIKGEE